MLARDRGTIVNVSSITGKTGVSRQGAYVTSKYGLQGLTNVLAKELRETGIRVSAVCPGQVDTAMTEGIAEGSLLEPADVAEAIGYFVDRDPDVYVPELVLLSPDSIPMYSH
jgi:NAD(P)-dependent dehydrogenase (short-subunit alcohol dehydrogenase family)